MGSGIPSTCDLHTMVAEPLNVPPTVGTNGSEYEHGYGSSTERTSDVSLVMISMDANPKDVTSTGRHACMLYDQPATGATIPVVENVSRVPTGATTIPLKSGSTTTPVLIAA
jgi:hypothetical protein